MVFAGHAADIDKPDIAEQIISIKSDAVLTGFFAPIQGNVISHFGYRGKHFHAGTDIKLHRGDTVRAAFDGLVMKACPYSGYGNLVILKHPNSIETYYSHLSKCIVQFGDSVKAGQVVGLGGRTGRATTDHLHFEVRFNHVAKNAEKYFDFKNCEVKDATDASLTEDTHIIRKGDTLYSLSKRYGTTVKQLQELNKMENSNLQIGLKLKVK